MPQGDCIVQDVSCIFVLRTFVIVLLLLLKNLVVSVREVFASYPIPSAYKQWKRASILALVGHVNGI